VHSGPIILLIVALWAAVLVPAMLRRRDDVTETRSVARFTRAMRTLRRDDVLPADDRTILMPRRPAAAMEPQLFSKSDGVPRGRVSAAARPASSRSVSSQSVSSRPVSQSASSWSAAPRPVVSASLRARRLRAVRTLAIAVVVTLLLGLVGSGLLWMLHGLVDGVAAVYVVHLRAEAKRAAALARRRPRPRAEPVASRPHVESAEDVPAPAAEQHRVSFDDGVAETAAADAVANSSRAWQPIPVPVPTYVTAPKAPRRGKQIEVPPSWSDGLRDDGADIDLTALDRIEPEIDRLLERRRAVND
jgi:hypothetical protein